MRKEILNIIFSVLICMPYFSYGQDLGVQGKIWDIKDIDLRLIVMKQLSEINWKDNSKKYEKSIRDQLSNMEYTVTNPPVDNINIKQIDMSTVITKDITAPVRNADGSIRTVVLAKAGQVVDPFKYVQPVTKYLFFDPADDAQKKFASLVRDSDLVEQYDIQFVITGGDILGTAKDFHGVFYAYPYISKKFKLEHNLSFVFYSPVVGGAVVAELPRTSEVKDLEKILKKYVK